LKDQPSFTKLFDKIIDTLIVPCQGNPMLADLHFGFSCLLLETIDEIYHYIK